MRLATISTVIAEVCATKFVLFKNDYLKDVHTSCLCVLSLSCVVGRTRRRISKEFRWITHFKLLQLR